MKRCLRSILLFVVICIFTILVHAVCNAAGNAEPWKGNKIGISDVPPPPFTAVTVKMNGDAAIIGCWGRTYTLANTGLPVQIRSKDADLLAAPVRLIAESGGAPVEWKSTGVKLVKSSQVQVVLEGTAQSSIGKLDWKCTAEYDGLLRYDLQITPLPGATVDKLELVFSVKPEHAPLMWLPGQYPVARHGKLIPQSGGANWYTWLGDMDRGLAMFFETDEAWDDPGRADAWRLEQLPNSVDTAWRFIQGNKALPSPWKYTFGIEATPVKKTPGGRKWVWAGTRPAQPGNFVAREYFPESLKHFGYPEATSDAFRKEVASYHSSGLMVCPYVLLNVLSAGAPELAAHPEWKTAYPPIPFAPIYPWDGADPCVKAFREDLWEILPTQDFIDWIVWKCDQFVRENDLDGMYHDFTMLMVLQDIPQGFGYMRNGTPVRCYPFFERRELYKRIYTMLKQYKKDAINIGHMSGDMYVPLLSFCDVILNGEHFGGVYWNGKTYPELMTDDYLYTEMMGHNYGLTTALLEMWGNRGTTPPEKMWEHDRFLSGLSLLYDFGLVRPTDAKTAAYKAFSKFGAIEAKFIPFWHLGEIVRGQTDEVRCSAYRKKDGGSMLVFFNRAKEAREITFTVDWAKLKSPGPVVVRYAIPTGSGGLADDKLPVKDDKLTVKIPAEDFLLVRVK